MPAKHLLIADYSEEIRRELPKMLSDEFTIHTAADGAEAWELLQNSPPDIFLLDVMLPETDGLTLLRRCADQGIRPIILVTTRIYSDYLIHALMQYGVTYVIPKPYQLSDVAEQVREVAGLSLLPEAPRKQSINEILLRLGFSRKLNGTRYLQHAIRLFSQDPQQMLTKELYSSVGQLCHATASQVERCIRSAIAAAWNHRDEKIWLRYFPAGEMGAVRRPTNGEFITGLSILFYDSTAA